MYGWEELLATELARRAFRMLAGLSFTRLCWLTEHFDRTVLPFLRGEFDQRLKGMIPPMPLREVDAEQWMLERNHAKPPEAP